LTVSVTPTNTGNVAFLSFANTSWANATITAQGALIYNTNLSNAAVCSLAFGGDRTSTNGTFAVNFPTADATNAIIRLTAS
jgi:VCBS repeat-containing protein